MPYQTERMAWKIHVRLLTSLVPLFYLLCLILYILKPRQQKDVKIFSQSQHSSYSSLTADALFPSKARKRSFWENFVAQKILIIDLKQRKREIDQASKTHREGYWQMDCLLGLLRIRVKRGVNLAIRDMISSDPYVVIKMGTQKLKTRVIKKDVNPVWNEDLTLSVTDPEVTVHLTVYDHDTFTKDDEMGDAEFEIKSYLEAVKMDLSDLPSGTVVSGVHPSDSNCLADESYIRWVDGKLVQDLVLRLRNVECGEVELQLQWIDLPGSKGLNFS